MASDERSEPREPVFADFKTIESLLGVPKNTLRQLARELRVACHKLGDGAQSKCVYYYPDVRAWVESQPMPEWAKGGLA